jgi:hypothetical protein
MKTLTHDEYCSKSRIKILVLASFPAIGQFAPVFTSYGCRKNPRKCTFHWRLSEQFSRSQAAFETLV